MRYKTIRWSPEEIELLHKYYPSSEKGFILGLFPNRSWDGIDGAAGRYGLKRDTYKKPILDFSEINTEFKAYLLGYIAADGYINLSKGKYCLCFSVAEKDGGYLEQIRQLLCPSATFLTYDKWKKDKNGNALIQHRFDVNNKEMVQQLLKWALHPNKSLVLKFPRNLPKEMYWHWFRGFFDGDGTIQIQKKDGWPQCGFVGTYDVLQTINQIFYEYFPHRVNIFFEKPLKKQCVLIYGGITAAVFLDRLYQDSTFHMERKYLRAAPFIRQNLKKMADNLSRNIWFSVDLEFLIENYPAMSPKELSNRLNKSLISVNHRIRILGLNKINVEPIPYLRSFVQMTKETKKNN